MEESLCEPFLQAVCQAPGSLPTNTQNHSHMAQNKVVVNYSEDNILTWKGADVATFPSDSFPQCTLSNPTRICVDSFAYVFISYMNERSIPNHLFFYYFSFSLRTKSCLGLMVDQMDHTMVC